MNKRSGAGKAVRPRKAACGGVRASPRGAKENARERTAAKLLAEQERRYRLLAESVGASLAVIDARGRFRYANGMANRDFRVRCPDGLEGKHLREVFPPEMATRQLRAVREVIRTGRRIRREVLTVTGAGNRWCDVTLAPFPDFLPDRKAVLCVARDIHAEKMAQDELREKDRLIRAVTTASPDLQFLLDIKTGRITYMSPASKRIIGFSPEEILALGPDVIRTIVHPDDLPIVNAAMGQVASLADGEVGGADYRARRRSGGYRWLRGRHVVFRRDRDGSVREILVAARDTTEGRETQDLYRTLAENSLQGLVINQRGRLAYVNEAAAKIFGRSVENLMCLRRREVERLVHPEDRGRVWDLHRQRLQGLAVPARYEARVLRPNGEVRNVEVVSTRVEHRGAVAALTAFMDVTENRRTVESLRESEERYRNLFDGLTDAVLVMNMKPRFVNCNAAATRLLGYTREELLRLPPRDLVHPAYHKQLAAGVRQTKQGLEVFVESMHRHRDGHFIPVEVASRRIRRADGEVITAVVRDIRRRKELEHDILRVSDYEKNRIGQDIHDTLVQHLAGTAMLADTVAMSLADEGSSVRDRAARLSALMREGMTQARTIARGLFPVDPREGGLNAALRRMADEEEGLFGVHCRLSVAGAARIRDEATANHVYYIVREAANNAVRHGRATEIDVRLDVRGGKGRLRVADNGKGMTDEAETPGGGMGLRIMRYRAAAIGGSLEMCQCETGGVAVECSFPVGARSAPAEKKGAGG